MVNTIFILAVVFLGKNLAEVVILAGLLHGFSEACYWCSYNLMKNELVSKHAVAKYSGLQVYYSTKNKESEKLANSIQVNVKKELQSENNRKIKEATSSIFLLLIKTRD